MVKKSKGLVDIQSLPDAREVPIEKVGIKGAKYPITVLDKAHGHQHTTAVVDLFADLPHSFKGAHMSRFIEVFEAYRRDLSMQRFLHMLGEIRTSLGAETAYATVKFPYFVEKHAPVSGAASILSYSCAYAGKVWEGGHEFQVSVGVPITTVCPCSKAISEHGAHNQRGVVTLTVTMGPFAWLEDLIMLIESCASGELYTLLKREDEKYVTEHAFENPRFVEDVARDVFLHVKQLNAFVWFAVEAENFESIHDHSAYAYVSSDVASLTGTEKMHLASHTRKA